jgi:hypothetical protein
MTTGAVAPLRSPLTPERETFWYLVHAEWTKFRTVRGWVIAVLITIAAITAFAFLGADAGSSCTEGNGASGACPAQPTGPGGVPVQGVFYFAHQPVAGNGTITVQVTSLTGQTLSGATQLALRRSARSSTVSRQDPSTNNPTHTALVGKSIEITNGQFIPTIRATAR